MTSDNHVEQISKLKSDHQLTYRQAAFAYYFTGNATAAARLAGYQGTGTALSVQGLRNLKLPKVIEAIQARTAAMPDAVLNPQEILLHWSRIVRDPLTTSQDRQKALESLARSHAMFTDKSISLNYTKSDRIDSLTDKELDTLLAQTVRSLLDVRPDLLTIGHDDQPEHGPADASEVR